MAFLPIPQTERSQLITSVITPFARFRFNCLPFGVYYATEHFQRRMSDILHGLGGVACQIDDVLVWVIPSRNTMSDSHVLSGGLDVPVERSARKNVSFASRRSLNWGTLSRTTMFTLISTNSKPSHKCVGELGRLNFDTTRHGNVLWQFRTERGRASSSSVQHTVVKAGVCLGGRTRECIRQMEETGLIKASPSRVQ